MRLKDFIMKMKLLFLFVLMIFGALTIDAQVRDFKPKSGTMKPAGRSYFYAELVSSETSDGRQVTLQIDKDYRNYFSDTNDQKMIAALMTQQFQSIPQALSFLSMNGWEFVDQFAIHHDREVEQRVLVRRPAAMAVVAAPVKTK